MPTGYTYKIIDGDGVTFKQFAMECARAFGALIELRDEPEEIKPSTHHADELVKLKKEWSDWVDKTLQERLAWAEERKASTVAGCKSSVQKHESNRIKLLSMRLAVTEWVPPSSDHEGLKSFMLEQIDSTMTYDGDLAFSQKYLKQAEDKDPAEYVVEHEESIVSSITYHEKNLREEITRCADRTRWIKQLRASLITG